MVLSKAVIITIIVVVALVLVIALGVGIAFAVRKKPAPPAPPPVPPSTPCSPTNPSGYCTPPNLCVSGACRAPCSQTNPCPSGQSCVAGVCSITCSAGNPCPSGQTCITGSCTPNCSSSSPNGYCASGTTCSGGTCQPSCSLTNPDGACSAGLSCLNGSCNTLDCGSSCDLTKNVCIAVGSQPTCAQPYQIAYQINPDKSSSGECGCVVPNTLNPSQNPVVVDSCTTIPDPTKTKQCYTTDAQPRPPQGTPNPNSIWYYIPAAQVMYNQSSQCYFQPPGDQNPGPGNSCVGLNAVCGTLPQPASGTTMQVTPCNTVQNAANRTMGLQWNSGCSGNFCLGDIGNSGLGFNWNVCDNEGAGESVGRVNTIPLNPTPGWNSTPAPVCQ